MGRLEAGLLEWKQQPHSQGQSQHPLAFPGPARVALAFCPTLALEAIPLSLGGLGSVSCLIGLITSLVTFCSDSEPAAGHLGGGALRGSLLHTKKASFDVLSHQNVPRGIGLSPVLMHISPVQAALPRPGPSISGIPWLMEASP